MSSEPPRMPVVVTGGGEAADAGDRPIYQRINRNNSSALRRSLSAGFALIIVIAAAGTAARPLRHCRVAGETDMRRFIWAALLCVLALQSSFTQQPFSYRPGSSGSRDWRRICGGPRRSVQDRIRAARRRGKMPSLRGHDRSAGNRKIRQQAGRYRQKSRLSLRACAQGSALARRGTALLHSSGLR
jgi:hypothetical protein